MIFLLSGEGPTDLGSCRNAQGSCQIPDLEFGPMGEVVDTIVSKKLNYPVKETAPQSYIYHSEKHLETLERERKQRRRSVSLVGKKREQETGYFYINAWMLGEAAAGLRDNRGDDVIAILFRDSDGTRSTEKGIWEAKFRSMEQGFERSGIGVLGVPMLPKPKSESWMLCAAQEKPYQHCAVLEDLSGNDESPNSAKVRLTRQLNGKTSAAEQAEWILEHGFDAEAASAEMPSFSSFYNRMSDALRAVAGS